MFVECLHSFKNIHRNFNLFKRNILVSFSLLWHWIADLAMHIFSLWPSIRPVCLASSVHPFKLNVFCTEMSFLLNLVFIVLLYIEISRNCIDPNFIFFSFSGLVWPIESHHFLLKLVSPYFPLVLPTEGLRAVTAKEWGIDHPVVIKGFQSSFIWCSIFIIGVFLTLKFKKNALIIYKWEHNLCK